ncbi:MAG: type II toxin-antitoxin system VapC family toxin [Candidatus Altiarchaeales archaeon]|nr:type II toxin-antitoxin system VapC family toxin [Candidatus Altiarchaeales archaeon]
MYFLDTNIILEAELKQQKSEEARKLLSKLKDNKLKCLTTDFHAYSTLVIIENHGTNASQMAVHISSLIGYDSLTIYRPSIYDWLKAAKHMQEHKLDFDDALAYQSMKANNIDKIISYDKHFDKLKDIKRLEPTQA